MTDSRNINVDYCVIELSPSKRDKENPQPFLESSSFVFQSSDCRIKVSLGWETIEDRKIKVYLKSLPLLSPDFYVTVFLLKGNSIVPYPKSKVQDPSLCIWSSSFRQIARQLPGIEKWNFGFKFILQRNPDHEQSSSVSEQKSVHSHSLQNLSEDFAKLLDNGSEHDVELKSGEEVIKAHKAVLRARSPFFQMQLQGATRDRIDLDYMDPAAFHEVVRFIYTAKTPDFSFEHAKKIYKAASICKTRVLRELSMEFLIENLTENNACECLELADDDCFKERIIGFMMEKGIPYLDEYWKPFCDKHPRSANDVLNKFIAKLRPPSK